MIETQTIEADAFSSAIFELGEEHQMFREAVRGFLAGSYAPEVRRRAIASESGRRPEFWQSLARDIGLLGVGFDEELGGAGGGALEHAIVMEAFGEALVVEPYIPTVVVAGSLLRRSSAAWAANVSEDIIAGRALIGNAFAEAHARFDPADLAVTAGRTGDSYVLEGRKAVVYGAPWATHFLVTARTSGAQREREGVSLFLVDAEHPAIRRHDYATIDGGRASDLTFERASVPASALVFDEGAALPFVEQALDEATAAVCAESVGVMARMLRETVAYLRERRQFGKALAEFQVLQHRMADMFVALEQSIAITFFAAAAVAGEPPARAAGVSAAKAFVGRSLRMIAQNAVQMHGGMGVTEELEIGQLFKRATVAERAYGSIEDHLRRYASLGYREFV
jgi:alkylation response protein AidB-like acyl-CoA dehydrogenase